jgi:carboxyl-terminal processing protease
MSRRYLLLWISPMLLLSVWAGLLLARTHRAEAAVQQVYWEDELFRTIRELVGRRYVDDLGPERSRELFHRSVKAYMDGLDPYCAFYAPDELTRLQEDTRGEFGGIGVYLTSTPEGLHITGVREDAPAWKGGIRPGDLIVVIEGEPVDGMSQRDLVTRLKGPVGSTVKVRVRRGEEEPFETTLTRDRIRIESVRGVRLVDEKAKIGYVRIDSFRETTVDDFREALLRLRDELGATSLVLDLRRNDGGVLPAAVDVVDRFLARGDVVTTRGRSEGSVRVYAAREEGTIFPEEPLVVLVDGTSASASEVVAGALQDHRRAVLVGERTYGKFLVQSIIELENGADTRAAIRLTTAKYLTPFGRFLQRDDERGVRGGLLPEVVVPVSADQRVALAKRWNAEHAPGWHHLEEESSEAVPDPQLEAAVDLLRGVAVVERIVTREAEEK